MLENLTSGGGELQLPVAPCPRPLLIHPLPISLGPEPSGALMVALRNLQTDPSKAPTRFGHTQGQTLFYGDLCSSIFRDNSISTINETSLM